MHILPYKKNVVFSVHITYLVLLRSPGSTNQQQTEFLPAVLRRTRSAPMREIRLRYILNILSSSDQELSHYMFPRHELIHFNPFFQKRMRKLMHAIDRVWWLWRYLPSGPSNWSLEILINKRLFLLTAAFLIHMSILIRDIATSVTPQ